MLNDYLKQKNKMFKKREKIKNKSIGNKTYN